MCIRDRDIIRTVYYIHGPWRAKKNFCCFICVRYGPYTLLQNDSFFYIYLLKAPFNEWMSNSRHTDAGACSNHTEFNTDKRRWKRNGKGKERGIRGKNGWKRTTWDEHRLPHATTVARFVEQKNLEDNSTSTKVKASRTRYRALGSVRIPVYRQSARKWLKSSTRR